MRDPRLVPPELPANLYLADPAFQDLLRDQLGAEGYAWGEPLLERMGELAAQVIPPLAAEADAHVPELVQYDAAGVRLDEVRYHPSYREMIRLAYGSGLAGMFYDSGLRAKYGYVPHALVFGMGYLFGQAEQGLYCPVCMTEGAARLIDRFGDEALRARYMPGLTSRDPATLLQGAMFLTEKQGGSDVGANDAIARREGDQWRLYGEKWFCSNAGEAGVMMVLARPEGAVAGTRGLGLFVMPKHWEGERNHYRIDRLKDKLGTRSMATGEFTLEGAYAHQVGEINRGFKYMTDMLNLSRTYNSVAALAIMRRALTESVSYASNRPAFGAQIDRYPMVRATLSGMAVELEASTALVFEAIRLLDLCDSGKATEDERRMMRLLTPMIKYHTGRQAVRFASEACEMLAGNGYVETFVTPRLYRDAQVLPIWEGTTNILVLDVLRCLVKEQAGPALAATLRSKLAQVVHPALAGIRARLENDVATLETTLRQLLSQDEALVTLHAKAWSDRVIRVYEAVLLLVQAERELGRGRDRKVRISKLHAARFLDPQVFGSEGWCADPAWHADYELIARQLAPTTAG